MRNLLAFTGPCTPSSVRLSLSVSLNMPERTRSGVGRQRR
jgi:hypothetical protein